MSSSAGISAVPSSVTASSIQPERPGQRREAAAESAGVFAAEEARVRSGRDPRRAAPQRYAHILIRAARVFRAKSAPVAPNGRGSRVLFLRCKLHRCKIRHIARHAALEQEHTHRRIGHDKRRDRNAVPADGSLPAGIAEAERYAARAAIRKEAFCAVLRFDPQPFRARRGERVARPRDDGALPGVFVPERRRAAVRRGAAETAAIEHICPCARRQRRRLKAHLPGVGMGYRRRAGLFLRRRGKAESTRPPCREGRPRGVAEKSCGSKKHLALAAKGEVHPARQRERFGKAHCLKRRFDRRALLSSGNPRRAR